MDRFFTRLFLIGIPLAVGLFFAFRYLEEIIFDIFGYSLDRTILSFLGIFIIFRVLRSDLKIAIEENKARQKKEK